MPKRLTRDEKRQRTRSSLLRSAAKVFACRGMDRASIDEVAEEAGYTKGAFYANFKSKEELFLAMLDERFAERVEHIDRIIGSGEGIEAQAEQALRNVEALLQEADLSLGDVVSCLVHLSDLSLFQRYNAVWERVFATEPRPVRTTVGAPLLNEMLIEVTAIARRP